MEVVDKFGDEREKVAISHSKGIEDLVILYQTVSVWGCLSVLRHPFEGSPYKGMPRGEISTDLDLSRAGDPIDML